MPARERRSDGPQRRPNAFALAGLGMMNAACILGGAAVGWFADSKLDTAPIFILLGLLWGIVSGVLATYKEVRKYLND